MKKIFFTAIALVAFSATSMANKVEVKEVAISEGEKEVVVKKSCMEAALDYYEAVMDQSCGSPGCGGDDMAFLNRVTSRCK